MTPFLSHRIAVLDANFYWAEQLYSAYAEYADVLLLRPVDFRAFKRRYGKYFIDTHPQPTSAHIWEQRICCPPGWLFYYWPLTQFFLYRAIRRFQADGSLTFVFSYPYYAGLARALNTYSIYYAIDDYQDYWPKRQAQTIAQEKQAIATASLTLCAAKHRLQHLQMLYPEHAERIVHIPHGCSPRFIADQVLEAPQLLPSTLQKYGIDSNKRPIAGYIGALNYRFDFSFLAAVAKQMPELTFVLGGKLPSISDGSVDWWQGVERCKALSNIRFIGFVPHEQLGAYLQSFDVLLMLYSKCSFNQNACPTKLWDYMGTSRPIVANSAVPEVLLWQDLFHVVQTPQQYVMAIRNALAEPSWQANERLSTAQSNTWKDQSRKLHNIIQPLTAAADRTAADSKISSSVKVYG